MKKSLLRLLSFAGISKQVLQCRSIVLTDGASTKRRRTNPPTAASRIKYLSLCCIFTCIFSIQSFADYTVASGTTINASTLTGQSGVLTINGTLSLSSNVSLLGFTSVVINGPSGQIYWTNNSDLTFSAGITISISSTAPGLMPTIGNGNSSQRLIVGTTIISVSSDNSTLAAFSFSDFNDIGGLPQFTITSNSPVCNAALSLGITPDRTSNLYFSYAWSISSGSNSFSANNTSSQGGAGTTISPAPGTYTITCTVSANGNAFSTKTTTVTTNSAASAPPAITATASAICLPSGTTLSATSAGSTIEWYTTVGGTSIGSSASGAGFTVYPTSTTSYYAQAVNASACATSARTAAKTITVNAQAAITGTLSLCIGSATTLTGTGTPASNAWQSSAPGVATISSAGLVTGISAGTTTITYTNTAGCSATAFVTVVALPVITGTTTVCSGYTTPLAATGSPAVSNSWVTSTPGVATVSNTGVVTGVAAGSALITFTNSTGCTKSITVTVNQPAAITIQPVSTPVCLGTNATITVAAVGTGILYQWELSSDNGVSWADVPNNAQYSGSTSNILQVINPGVSVVANLYRLRVSTPSNCGNTAWSNSTHFPFKNVWLGTVSTDWNNGANWSDGAVPTLSCPAVSIITSHHQPILSSGTVSINNLVIYSGALTVTNAVLNIAGSITNNGVLDVSDGTLNFNGTSLQSVAGSYLVNNTLKNLTISNPAGLSVISHTTDDSLNITGTLAFGAVNNAPVYTGDRVVLVSNAGGTARVGDITNNGVNSGNNFVGKVTVQRHFTSRRSWRLATAPLSAAGSIFDTWQNGGNYRPGTGTYVTGATATNPRGSNGLDWSVQNNSSLKMGSGLTPVLNTHTAFLSRNLADTSDNNSYFIFVRGDRDPVNTTVPYSNATTVSSKGKLQTGRQTFAASPVSDAFTLVGNPYAAPVDFNKLGRTNLYKRMYVWDPYLNTDLGGYVLVDDVDNDGVYSISPASPGGLNQVIQSGQAFWVHTIANNPASLTFQESAKSPANSNLTAFRPPHPIPALAINVTQPGANNAAVLLDGILVEFDSGYSKRIDMQDAIKFSNVKETIASERSGTGYALERRPLITDEDTIFIKLTKTTQRSYNLEFLPVNFDTGLTAFLEDAYTKTKTTLPVSQHSKYNFVINNVAASGASNRFRIVFRQTPPVVPPFSFREITAEKEAGNIAIEWSVLNEVKGNAYHVEKSVNGTTYADIDSAVATTAVTGITTYKSLDQKAAYGRNFYRIRYKNASGNDTLSKPVEVVVGNGSTGIGVYPNPVTNGTMGLAFTNMPGGAYVARLRDANGATVLIKKIEHATGTRLLPVQLEKTIPAGVFHLEILCPDNTSKNLKVVVL